MRTALQRILRIVSVVRLRPYDTGTPEGRSRERYRRAALTSLSSLLARGATILTALISVPLTIHYLGSERYGMWLTISSLVAFLSFADLGMGNGLLTLLGRAHGRDDLGLARRVVSSASFTLSGMAVLLVVGFGIAYPFIPWKAVFNISSSTALAEAGPATAVFVGCWTLSLAVGVVQKVNLGYQDGLVNNLWQALGSLLALGAVILTIVLEAGLPWLVLSLAGMPALATLLNGVVLFGKRRPQLRPKARWFRRKTTKTLLRMGSLFVSRNLAYQATINSGNIIVTQFLGPALVQQLAVPARLFAVFGMFMNMFIVPLWPAYAEAIAKGDVDWASRTLRASIRWSAIAGIVPLVLMLLLGQDILRLWVGDAVSPTLSLLLALGLWYFQRGITTSMGVFLDGANALRFQAVVAVAEGVAVVGLSCLLVQFYGVTGIAWAMVIASVSIRLVPTALYLPRIVRSLGG